MNTRQMAALIWLRLIAVIVFTILMAVQELWLLVAIGVGLALLTVVQLFSAYRSSK